MGLGRRTRDELGNGTQTHDSPEIPDKSRTSPRPSSKLRLNGHKNNHGKTEATFPSALSAFRTSHLIFIF